MGANADIFAVDLITRALTLSRALWVCSLSGMPTYDHACLPLPYRYFWCLSRPCGSIFGVYLCLQVNFGEVTMP